jgi:AcrR family transcriptional regulator
MVRYYAGMSTPVAVPSRRELVRARTIDEIKARALEQIADSGPESLSLNAIARSMQMSGPALYRYFASREELLTELVVDGYDALADICAAAARDSTGQPPADRLRALGRTAREWARAEPHRYRLIFASRYGSGNDEPDRIVPAARRVMASILEVLAEVRTQWTWSSTPELDAQLKGWHSDDAAEPLLPPGLLQAGILFWTRLHGVVSLELEGTFACMGIDAGLIFDVEVERFVSG